MGLVLLWILVVVAVVFVEAFWFAEPSVIRGDVASIEQHLVREMSEAAADRRLGSAALVLIQGGRIVAEHGFGVANAETGGPVKTDQTLYRVASVSKAVTAWGVMKLVEDGKLSLDEPVMRHLKRWRFPGSEAYRDRVTIRHLLSHTAGLDDGLGYGGFGPGETVQTLEESLTLTKDSTVSEPRAVTVVREPGTAMAYSSGGYTILQLLIEEVTNRPFADYMKDAVLQPLGMTKSSFDLDAIISEGRTADLATSYDREIKAQPPRRHTSKAGVGLYTTPQDLARFALAFTGTSPLLKEETVKQMMMPQPGTGGSWGLGPTLFIENSAGGHVVGHDGGSIPAWGAWMRVDPATGDGFVMMVSGGSGTLNQLPHDWIYWETGKATSDARRQLVQTRSTPALIAIILGAIAIVIMRWTLVRKATSMLSRVSTVTR